MPRRKTKSKPKGKTKKPKTKIVHRDSITGRFITKEKAKRRPKTTETERVRTGN